MASKPFHVRKTTWEEITGQWQELVHASYHEAYDGIGAMYSGVSDLESKIAAMERYQEYGQHVWGAFWGGKLVGLITGTVNQGVYVIWDLFVHPGFRRRGIGRALVETSIQDSGCKKVQAEIREGNVYSQQLFLSLGLNAKHSAILYELELE